MWLFLSFTAIEIVRIAILLELDLNMFKACIDSKKDDEILINLFKLEIDIY